MKAYTKTNVAEEWTDLGRISSLPVSPVVSMACAGNVLRLIPESLVKTCELNSELFC
jgi:hypothetical protein